jgi:rhodanese-related sulfurtransferase
VSRIDEHIRAVRARLWRVSAEEAASLVAAGGLLIDIRPIELRRRDGQIPGSLIIDRNSLEWRLDPTSPWRHPVVRPDEVDQTMVIFCDEGYASSLAAASLSALGLRNVADLEGGFQGWRNASLPVVPSEARDVVDAPPTRPR